MPLNFQHDKIDEIPEAYRPLYSEQGGKFLLTGVAGVKTQADVDRLTESLRKERDDHKATKQALTAWGTLKPDETLPKLDRIAELEVAAAGKKEEMDKQLESLTEARVRTRLAPVERENSTLKEELKKIATERDTLKAEKRDTLIRQAALDALIADKVTTEAQPDALLLASAVFTIDEQGNVLTAENRLGIPPGLTPKLWLAEMQAKGRPWWPPADGGGSRGSQGGNRNGENPWSAAAWNVTKQGAVVREKGMEVARQMAASAGTSIGGPRPPLAKK